VAEDFEFKANPGKIVERACLKKKKNKKKLLEPKPCHSMTVALITETAPK
jgi:hypothetical protein